MSLCLIVLAVGLVSFVVSVLVGKAIARQDLAARIAPHVATDLDERTAVHPGSWIDLSRNRWPS